eukprot:NODE_21342_length_758_cov_5.448494.p1 GENE.NODE_21342_length_758_cov_5.448494~~NODE_21342_length_758_cov_5.448494.p1  ORF type:complete len:181 (+),score=61.56 NODE_21342_length_758_cov_5.448494:160-702(+)
MSDRLRPLWLLCSPNVTFNFAAMGGVKGGKGVQQQWVKKGGKDANGKAPRVPYSELSEERKAEIRAKHEARAAEEGRVDVGAAFFSGTIVSRGRNYGWIKPAQPFKLPKNVQAKMREMTAEKKAKAIENGRADTFDAGVIYLRMSDVAEGVKVSEGETVQFRVYMDTQGVGAVDVFTEGQ